MKIGIGSKNGMKMELLAETLQEYAMFSKAEIEGVEVGAEQRGHPTTLEETVAGAVDRAKKAFEGGHSYGFGIENGLMEVPQTRSGYMAVSACAIYDGKQIHLGLSQAYEWPKRVMDAILHKETGGEQSPEQHGGSVGSSARGRANRRDYMKAAVMMALIHLENPEHY